MGAPQDQASDLTSDERLMIRQALRWPLGRYSYERASQLSGVPQRTLHHWAQWGVFKPDFDHHKPKQWSYRDLVLVRTYVWLRSNGHGQNDASTRTHDIRTMLEDDTIDPFIPLRAGSGNLMLEGETVDRKTNAAALPTVIDFLDAFYLFEPVDDLKAVNGPSLLRPSKWTSISPEVHAGEPCVRSSRLPTATLWALHTQQELDFAQIANLYPSIGVVEVEDAVQFETKIRRLELEAA